MAIEQNLADILAARYGRDVRQSIHDGIAECYSDVSEAKTRADESILNVDAKVALADAAALNANQKADLANTAAQTANTAATNADQKADLANTAAQNADSKAALANAATEAANTAISTANTAATNADQKAAMANAATEAANTATNNANVATTNVQAAIETANTAATNADQKASLANTAAANADQKAELANTAAGSANTAASSANTAAQTANAAADNAEAKATLANNAAQYASGFTQPYIHIKYSAVQPTSNADMVDVPSDWIGLYSGNSATAPVNYTDYRWFRYKGEAGDVGNHNHDTLYLGIAAKAADSDKLDGKDSTEFSDKVHAHTKSEITDFPETMPPSPHNHGTSDITDFPTEMPASDVHPWAKAAEKPTYTPSEVGALALTAVAADSDKLDGLHASEVAFASMASFSLVGDDLVVTTPTGYTGPTFAIDINGDLIATFSGSSVNIGKVRGYCPYDVGDIYQTTNATNPSTKWAGTTWEAIGEGRVLVGIDPNDTDFDTVGKQGGEKSHELTVDELANHRHLTTGMPNSSSFPYFGAAASSNIDNFGKLMGTVQGASAMTAAGYLVTGYSGAGEAHNNMPPYLVVYMWKRTA